jgi:tRNA threonylcarbamoyladenosine biosynthesis protein TsaB
VPHPIVLALDTTHEFGSVALTRGSELLEELPLHAPTGFAHILYPHLAALLERHRLALSAINLFAAASGPGSFTGVRVGLACIKGLAEALRKPAVAVSNLQALSTFGTAPLRAVFLDARREEIFGAVYDSSARLVLPEVVAKLPAWLATLPENDLEFVCPDFAPYQPLLAASRFAATRVTTAPRALAGAIARLACIAEPQDPAALDANYVRRSDAELHWKE